MRFDIRQTAEDQWSVTRAGADVACFPSEAEAMAEVVRALCERPKSPLELHIHYRRPD